MRVSGSGSYQIKDARDKGVTLALLTRAVHRLRVPTIKVLDLAMLTPFRWRIAKVKEANDHPLPDTTRRADFES